MISDKKIQTKQEGVTNIINDEATRLFSSKATSSNNTSRQWSSAFRNPRIVRVSRAFGGKDRHSKVCTIRGLRDRRIRLSVPTAIQLYDLQDRLGLTQPSKVIDWLIDNTKDDIDNLPPLQIPQLGFGKFESNNPLVPSALMFDPNFRKSLVSNKEENRFKGFENDEHPSSLFNNGFPYNFDPSNLSLSSSSSTQYGGNHDNNSTPNSIGSQFLFCPPPPSNMPNSILPTYAHQYFDSSSSSRFTQNTINNFNFLSSGNNNSSIKLPFSLNANPGFDHPQNQDQTHPDDDKH